MKRDSLLFGIALALLVICIPGVVLASGDIQITCEPGIRIWIDDDLKGKTRSDENGMYIEGLSPGTYSIKAVKTGFIPETKRVNVQNGRTIEVKIYFKTPSVKVENLNPNQGATLVQQTGTMVLRSVPLHAEIYLDGKKIGNADKKISNLPAGKHTVKFVFKGKELVGTFDLEPNETLKLKGHFKKNEIIAEKNPTIAAEGDYVLLPNGIVRDRETDLEWKVGPDRDTDRNEARSWVQGLNLDGGGWRMPTIDELAGLYKNETGSRNMTPLLKTTGWYVWSGETKVSSDPYGFSFGNGRRGWHYHVSTDRRAFAVRSRSD